MEGVSLFRLLRWTESIATYFTKADHSLPFIRCVLAYIRRLEPVGEASPVCNFKSCRSFVTKPQSTTWKTSYLSIATP